MSEIGPQLLWHSTNGFYGKLETLEKCKMEVLQISSQSDWAWPKTISASIDLEICNYWLFLNQNLLPQTFYYLG